MLKGSPLLPHVGYLSDIPESTSFFSRAPSACPVRCTAAPSFKLLLLVTACAAISDAQGTEISVAVNMGEGLIYFLVFLFFALNFCTPVLVFIYTRFLSVFVERAGKEVIKASQRFTERMSDAGRRTAQSIRPE
jgi:hypothetical protein